MRQHLLEPAGPRSQDAEQKDRFRLQSPRVSSAVCRTTAVVLSPLIKDMSAMKSKPRDLCYLREPGDSFADLPGGLLGKVYREYIDCGV